jgi:RND family efflux transporter MFP subunit
LPTSQAADKTPEERPDLSVLRMDRALEAEPPRHPGRRRTLVLAFVLPALAAGAWLFLRSSTWLSPRVATTTVQAVTPGEASTVLSAVGYTYARNRAAVGAKVIGRVLELRVEEGDRIQRGRVIAVLDSADVQAAVSQAEAGLTEARVRLGNLELEAARRERLAEAGVIPSAEAESAAAAREVAKAQVDAAAARVTAARSQLAYTVVRSPLSGIVIQKNVEVGEMVAPGGFTSQQSTGAIVRIADLSSLEVEADINEAFISRLQIGQPATIKVEAIPDRLYHGKLRQIVPTADRQKAVVQVKVTIADADARLVPDMSSTVTFMDIAANRASAPAKTRLFAARKAVRGEGKDAWVFQLEGDRVRRVAVGLGAEKNDQVEIVSGLSGGEELVLDPPSSLEGGQRVRRAKE